MRLALLFLLTAGLSGAALGCTCMKPDGLTDKEYRARLGPYMSIFEGEVVDVGEERKVRRHLKDGDTIEETVRSITFSVTRTWKGDLDSKLVVETDVSSSCQFLPTVGTKLTLKVARRFGVLNMALCSSIYPPERQRIEKLLGPGRAIDKSI